jgi:hypothetical protein
VSSIKLFRKLFTGSISFSKYMRKKQSRHIQQQQIKRYKSQDKGNSDLEKSKGR